MKINFFGADPAYHEARRHFVFKGNPPPLQSRAPIATQIKTTRTENGKGAARPALQDLGLFSPLRGVNGNAYARRPEDDENSIVTREPRGARLLGMLRRAGAALQLARGQ